MSTPDESLQSEHIHVTSRLIQAENTTSSQEAPPLHSLFRFSDFFSSPPASARPPLLPRGEGPWFLAI